jgi:hypothetical protein
VSDEIPAEPAGAPEEPAAPPPPPPVEEQAAAPVPDADADDDVIEIPTGEKLVPLSALTAAREKAKASKAEAERAKTLEAELTQLRSQVNASQPYIDAAKAMLEARQQQQAPPPPTGPTPEDVAELEEIARDFDFYDKAGQLDLEKAARHQKRVTQTAAKMAQAEVTPILHRTLSQDALTMLARAKNTKLPNGETADADILEDLWSRVARQPGGLQQLANAESARILWAQAHSLTRTRQAATPAKKEIEAPPPALFTERAGGKEARTISLNDGDKRLAKDLGMTEAEYQKEAAKMPAGWGSRS